jgi:ferredoxin
MRCVKECPGGAIPMPGDRPTIKIKIEDQEIEWADTHMGRCTLTHHGMNRECSPFLQKDIPGFDLKVRESNMSQESAYRMTYPLGTSGWRRTPESSAGATVGYYKQILDHVGYFAVCGAKGCIRACMAHLEKSKKIEQCQFPTEVFPRPSWKLPEAEADACGGVSEGKFPEEYTVPDEKAGSWK